MASIFAIIQQKNGKADDTVAELCLAAKKIDASASVTAIVIGKAADCDAVAAEAAKYYANVWKIAADALAYPNAEVIRPMLTSLIPAGSIVLAPFTPFGMDLCPGLSVKMNAAYCADVVGIESLSGTSLTINRQEYAGQVYARMIIDIAGGAVITCRPGVFASDDVPTVSGAIADKTADAGAIPAAKRRFLEVVEAEVGDVDITKSDVLVSVGRGIESQENIEIAFDLAKVMGADVSCSRPIVDAKWLEKSRQVGTSGQTVKPKVYMAMGISGAFQHLGGIKGNPFIVAVNKNSKAPIFQVAEVGIVGDILELIPALTEKIEELKS